MARILVVDDEEDIRDLLRELLESAGHAVCEAGDGDEGFRRFAAEPADLVITDILMPGKGGLALVERLREKSPTVKILAISGGGKDGKLNFLATARTYIGVRTLKKPFHAEELLGEVKRLLEGD